MASREPLLSQIGASEFQWRFVEIPIHTAEGVAAGLREVRQCSTIKAEYSQHLQVVAEHQLFQHGCKKAMPRCLVVLQLNLLGTISQQAAMQQPQAEAAFR